jgi:hypothetical protein
MFRAQWHRLRCQVLAVALVGAVACSDDATAPASDGVRVRLAYVGGRGGAAIRVSARVDTITESATVGASNHVVLRRGLGPNDSVEVRVEETGSSAPRFHPAIAMVTGASVRATQTFVLIPRRWTITSGPGTVPCSHSGQTVGIDLELAYSRSVADPSSFYWKTPNGTGGSTYRTATFPPAALPVPVAFDRVTAADPITMADSAAFWAAVDDLESAICTDAFRPAPMTAVSPSRGVAVTIDRDLDAVARGGPTTGLERGSTALVGGSVVCRSATCLTSRQVVQHELMHVLGFGHSCAWPSVMRAGCAGDTRASALDVAYLQVYYAARALQLSAGAQHSLGAAHQGQRVIVRGLPIEPTS